MPDESIAKYIMEDHTSAPSLTWSSAALLESACTHLIIPKAPGTWTRGAVHFLRLFAH